MLSFFAIAVFSVVLVVCPVIYWASLLKMFSMLFQVCVKICFKMVFFRFSCLFTSEGLPAVLPIAFFDLFPAAIVSLSAGVLHFFLSHRDDL